MKSLHNTFYVELKHIQLQVCSPCTYISLNPFRTEVTPPLTIFGDVAHLTPIEPLRTEPESIAHVAW